MKRRLALVSLALLTLSACGDELHDLGGEERPLFVVRGRRHGSLPSGTSYRVGILWAGPPVYVPYCHEHGPSSADPLHSGTVVGVNGCRDPYEVVPALQGPSVPLPAMADFEIPIVHLPEASVMIGALPSRVAYGTVILFDDLNGNGVLDFAQRCGGGGGRGDDLEIVTGGTGPTSSSRMLEPIYASSFMSLASAQTRVVYVEGPFDRNSYYYPHPRCDVLPPGGFSVWKVGSLLAPNSTCELLDPDERIELETESGDAFARLACPANIRDQFAEPPLRGLPGPTVVYDCFEGDMVASDTRCFPCPNIRRYALRGCYAEAECTTPDWDVPAPNVWPCGAPTGGH